jgi:hypothetical protein
MSESPVKAEVIVAKKAMIRELKAEQENLSFVQETMVEAFGALLTDLNSGWGLPLTDEELQGWPVAQAWKVRTVCRHVGQAMGRPKGKKPHWLNSLGLPAADEVKAELPDELDWGLELSDAEKDKIAKVSDAKKDKIAEYGYDSELHSAVMIIKGMVVEKSLKFQISKTRDEDAQKYMEARSQKEKYKTKQTKKKNRGEVLGWMAGPARHD